jgi:hypothetical protein
MVNLRQTISTVTFQILIRFTENPKKSMYLLKTDYKYFILPKSSAVVTTKESMEEFVQWNAWKPPEMGPVGIPK